MKKKKSKKQAQIKNNKLYFGFSFRVIIYIILIVSATLISGSLYYETYYSNITLPINYSTFKMTDYQVHLKDNQYYDTKVLPSNMEYIASLIDYIDVDLEYKLTSNQKMNHDYTYRIDAISRVYGDDDKSNILFEKKQTLLDNKKITIQEDNLAQIKENVKIEYDKFNDLISAFKSQYAINAPSDVAIVLNVTGSCNNKHVSNIPIKEQAQIKIPLTKQTINIKIENNSDYKTNNAQNDRLVIDNKQALITAIILTLIDLLLITKLLKLLNKCLHSDSKYTKMLNKILKENDAIIANANFDIDESKYLVIKIETFEELKDVHNNTGNPILYTEIHKDQKCLFSIIKDDTLYKYVLKSSDLEK